MMNDGDLILPRSAAEVSVSKKKQRKKNANGNKHNKSQKKNNTKKTAPK